MVLDHVAFTIAAGLLGWLFWYRAHESGGGDIVLGLRGGDLGFGGSSSGSKGDLLGFTGVPGRGTSSRGFNPGILGFSDWGVNGTLFSFVL